MRSNHTYNEEEIRKHVDPEDLNVMKQVIDTMPLYADLLDANIFIDCMTGDKTAIVVAEAFPENEDPIYEDVIVDKPVYIKNEPGVFRTFKYGVTSRDAFGVSQETFLVHQSDVPIMSADHTHPIAVLITEKRADNLKQNEEKLAFVLDILSRYDLSADYASLANQGLFGNQGVGSSVNNDEESLDAITIREMNHRVKNNLQTVASLLNIQSSKIEDPEVKALFTDSISRIKSIADVHDQLSKSYGETVDIFNLSKKICQDIRELSGIEYELTGDHVTIKSSQASAVGLIINELVENVVKHCEPPEGENKKVFIQINAFDKYVNITVRDNGKGFDEGYSKNIGMKLIERLVRETLKGTIELKKNQKNSIISIVFYK